MIMKIARLDRYKKIKQYLDYHPEVLTEDFCEMIADRFLNVNTIRKAIRQEYSKYIIENRNNFYLVPEYNEQEET